MLEKELIKLGYDLSTINYLVEEKYEKTYIKRYLNWQIEIKVYPNNVFSWSVVPKTKHIIRQKQVDELQIALNTMKKDLKIEEE